MKYICDSCVKPKTLRAEEMFWFIKVYKNMVAVCKVAYFKSFFLCLHKQTIVYGRFEKK